MSLGNIMETLETKKCRKNAVFLCKKCDFICYKKSNYDKHVKTKKHVYRLNGNPMETLETKKMPKNAVHFCDCGKPYNSKSGLWKHKLSCQKKMPKNAENVQNVQNENIYNIVTFLMKENNELKNMMIEQQTKMFEHHNKIIDQNNLVLEIAKNGTNNVTHMNSHNKAFNLNFFLNETCKNAMNITDFVDSIKLQLNDLIDVGELGYVEGISNIIVKNLNSLDVTERPIHCTDKKRETIYIKDENKWEKEDCEKKRLKKFINKVAFKNQRLLPQFKEKYPEYNNSESKYSDQYSKIVIEAMGGNGVDEQDKEDKIIKRISKKVIIDK